VTKYMGAAATATVSTRYKCIYRLKRVKGGSAKSRGGEKRRGGVYNYPK